MKNNQETTHLQKFERRKERRATIRMSLILAAFAATLLGHVYIVSQPTGDNLFKAKYCRFVNRDQYVSGQDGDKVWECPATRWVK